MRRLAVVPLLLLPSLASAQTIKVDLRTLFGPMPVTLKFARFIMPVSQVCESVVGREIAIFLGRGQAVIDTDGMVRGPHGESIEKRLVFVGCAEPARLEEAPPYVREELQNTYADARRGRRGAHAYTVTSPAAAPAIDPPSSLDWRGAGSKTTDSFQAMDPWRVRWSAVPTAPGPASILTIAVFDAAGTLVTTINSGMLSAPAEDVSTVHRSGSFYLEISGVSVNWAVRVP